MNTRYSSTKPMAMLCGALLLGVLCDPFCSAAETPDPAAITAFKEFAEKRQSMLSTLKTFEMKGSITIEEKIGAADRKPQELKFVVAAKGDAIREVVERDEGRETYYLHARRLEEVEEHGGESMAALFKLGEANIGVFNECPAFFEYSFLNLFIRHSGIPAWRVEELTSKEKWQNAVRNLRSASIGKDGVLRVSFSTEEGSSSAELIVPAGTREGYRIQSVSFFTAEHDLDRKIEVLEYQEDKDFGAIGRKYRVGVYRSEAGAPPSVVWDYVIDELKLNSPVLDESLVFRPESVDRILDVESGELIKASK